MNVVVLHNAVGPGSGADDLDVLVQVDAVRSALEELGHQSSAMALPEPSFGAREMLDDAEPDLVFNLVESVEGDDSRAGIVPGLLRLMGLPFTGCDMASTNRTTDKLLAKGLMFAAGIATPAWLDPLGESPVPAGARAALPGEFIIKSAFTQGSRGIDDASVVRLADEVEALAAVRSRLRGPEDRVFAEAFLGGREFNVSILDGAMGGGPEVLPPAEIVFDGFPAGKPRIVGYAAKWDPASFEYTHTPRRFSFASTDAGLLERVRGAAMGCWELFGLSGYARVDMRVDDQGVPRVLEVNTNPCLSPDAGFQAALAEGGVSFGRAVARIVDAAMTPRGAARAGP